jgi:NAD(P)-dependent dehydrogenase (short-subunit alcohol dehydrogenase family)
MVERGSGSIVITSSTCGDEPAPGLAHYTAAKHGVLGLMKNVALELAPSGVRCNAVNPGAVDSGMTRNRWAWDMYAGHAGGTEEDMIHAGYAYHLLRGQGFLAPEAIAHAALYLNSRLAAAVTGIAITVDAGHSLISGVNGAPVR